MCKYRGMFNIFLRSPAPGDSPDPPVSICGDLLDSSFWDHGIARFGTCLLYTSDAADE